MADLKDADVTIIDDNNGGDASPKGKSRAGRRPPPPERPAPPARPRGFRRGGIVTLVLIVLIAWFFWSWGFCRFYVGPGKMAIITAKTGAALPAGQILAEPGQKGVLKDVLGEGRHIWNPLFYDWEIVEAQFIPAGKIGLVTSLGGSPLPPGAILAEEGEKGAWRKVLGPGCYRYNPKGYAIELIDATSIPVGFAGVVTNRADDRGIRNDVLQPGMYLINPREYQVDAVEVGVNQVSLVGQAGSVILTKNVAMDENNQMIQRLNQNIIEEQKRRREVYQQQTAPATSGGHANARQYNRNQVNEASEQSVVDMLVDDPGEPLRRVMSKQLAPSVPGRSRQGRLPVMEKDVPPAYVLNQYVNFPSRDGFDISLDMSVEFELLPEYLPAIFNEFGGFSEMVDVKLMPQILSVSRLKGSAYRAVDFIAGLGREKFQNELTEALRSSLGDSHLIIHSALISNVNVPEQILDPLRVASLSKETNLTNKEKQNTAKKQADLNREISLIGQFGQQVAQETSKLKAQIHAEMEKTVATIHADTQRRVAAIDKETATVQAGRTVALGKAQAESVRLVEEEKAKGFGMKIQAFGKDGGDYALYEFAQQLNPNMTINLIHAGEGTLWTDLKNPTFSDVAGAKASGKK